MSLLRDALEQTTSARSSLIERLGRGEQVAPEEKQATDALVMGQDGEFIKGLRRFGYSLPAMTKAFVGQMAEPFAPDFARRQIGSAQQDINSMPTTLRPKVANLRDVKDLSDFGNWAASAAGEGLPSVGMAMGGGLVGRGLGALVGRAGLGGAVGGVGTMLPMEGGETAMDLQQSPDAMRNTTSMERAALSLGRGTVNAALENVVPNMLVLPRLLGKSARIGTGFGTAVGNTAKIGAAGAIGEFGTEAAQDLTGQGVMNYAVPGTGYDVDQAVEAGARGAVVGGGIGAVGGAAQAAYSSMGAAKDAVAERVPKIKLPGIGDVVKGLRTLEEDPEAAGKTIGESVGSMYDTAAEQVGKTGDYAAMAGQKAGEVIGDLKKRVDVYIAKNIKDPADREWFINKTSNLQGMTVTAWKQLKAGMESKGGISFEESLGAVGRQAYEGGKEAAPKISDWAKRLSKGVSEGFSNKEKNSFKVNQYTMQDRDGVMRILEKTEPEVSKQLKGLDANSRRFMMDSILSARDNPAYFAADVKDPQRDAIRKEWKNTFGEDFADFTGRLRDWNNAPLKRKTDEELEKVEQKIPGAAPAKWDPATFAAKSVVESPIAEGTVGAVNIRDKNDDVKDEGEITAETEGYNEAKPYISPFDVENFREALVDTNWVRRDSAGRPTQHTQNTGVEIKLSAEGKKPSEIANLIGKRVGKDYMLYSQEELDAFDKEGQVTMRLSPMSLAAMAKGEKNREKFAEFLSEYNDVLGKNKNAGNTAISALATLAADGIEVNPADYGLEGEPFVIKVDPQTLENLPSGLVLRQEKPDENGKKKKPYTLADWTGETRSQRSPQMQTVYLKELKKKYGDNLRGIMGQVRKDADAGNQTARAVGWGMENAGVAKLDEYMGVTLPERIKKMKLEDRLAGERQMLLGYYKSGDVSLETLQGIIAYYKGEPGASSKPIMEHGLLIAKKGYNLDAHIKALEDGIDSADTSKDKSDSIIYGRGDEKTDTVAEEFEARKIDPVQKANLTRAGTTSYSGPEPKPPKQLPKPKAKKKSVVTANAGDRAIAERVYNTAFTELSKAAAAVMEKLEKLASILPNTYTEKNGREAVDAVVRDFAEGKDELLANLQNTLSEGKTEKELVDALNTVVTTHVTQLTVGADAFIEKATIAAKPPLDSVTFTDGTTMSREEIAALTTGWIEKYAPGMKVRISLFDVLNSKSSVAGFALPTTDGNGTIAISTRDLSRNRLMGVLSHEFGHLLQFHAYDKASMVVRDKIVEAYQRDVAAAKGGLTKGRGLQRFGNAAYAEVLLRATDGTAEGVRTKMNEPSEIKTEDGSYIVSFPEWFANQFSKYVTSGADKNMPVPVRNFYKRVLDKLNEFFKEVILKLRPTAEFSSWIESLAAANTPPSAVESNNTSPAPAEAPTHIGKIPMWYKMPVAGLREDLRSKYPKGTTTSQLMADGLRTATTRRSFGKVGDTFEVNGDTYRITGVERIDLRTDEGKAAWSAKEGWDAEFAMRAYPTQVRTGATQTTFEKIDAPKPSPKNTPPVKGKNAVRTGAEGDKGPATGDKGPPSPPPPPPPAPPTGTAPDPAPPPKKGKKPLTPDQQAFVSRVEKLVGKRIAVKFDAALQGDVAGRYESREDALSRVREHRRGVIDNNDLSDDERNKILDRLKDEEQDVLADKAVLGILHIAAGAEQQAGLAEHEAFHGAFQFFFTPEERNALGLAFSQGLVGKRLREFFKDEPKILAAMKADPEEAAAYGLQLYMSDPNILQPGDSVKTLFNRFKAWLRKLFNILTPEEKAEIILRNFVSGQRAVQGTSPIAKILDKDKPWSKRAVEMTKEVGGLVKGGYDILLTGTYQRIVDKDNAALTKIAKELYSVSGEEGSEGGVVQRMMTETKRWQNLANRIFQGLSEDQLKQLHDAKIFAKPPSDPLLLDRYNQLSKLYKDLYNYQKDAGVAVKNAGETYYPLPWDPELVMKNKDAFLAMLDNYTAELENAKKTPNEIYEGIVSYLDRGEDLTNVLDENKVPLSEHVRTRSLAFISKEDRRPFMKDDPIDAATHYIRQATRQTEFVRSFGPDGRKLEAMKHDAAKTYGASKDDIALINDFVDSVMGNREAGMSRELKDLYGGLNVYQNYRLLPFSLFSSLVDPMGIAIRSNSVRDAWDTFAYSMKNLFKEWKKEYTRDQWEKIAEDWGIIEDAGTTINAEHLYTGITLRGTTKKLNDALFKYNLLNGWIRNNTIMAVKAAQRFMYRAAEGDLGKHSNRYLEELGLTKADVIYDKANGRILMRASEFEAAGKSKDEAAAAEEKIRNAVDKFVRQSLLNPNAAEMPNWASNPYLMPIAHLKQFVFAFNATVVRRVEHELENGNYKPIMLAAAYVPAMVAADFMKDMIGNAGEEPPYKKDWGVVDYTMHGVERSGFTGTGAFFTAAKEDIVRGGAGWESAMGPAFQQFQRGVKAMTAEDSGAASWNWAVKSMPLMPAYDQWLTVEAGQSK